MNACRRGLPAAALRACLAFALLAGTPPAPAQTKPLPAVVVWDFENQTPAAAAGSEVDASDWLARALSENLTAALLEVPGLAVVERQRLKDVLAEQKLGATELADQDTRLRLGRIVGAARMVFGGYFVLGPQVQVNVRVVDTATSRIVYADELNAHVADVMQQAQALNRRITRTLGDGAGRGLSYPTQAWQAYDRALTLCDAGRWEDAAAALQRLLEDYASFAPAQRQLQVVLDRVSRR